MLGARVLLATGGGSGKPAPLPGHQTCMPGNRCTVSGASGPTRSLPRPARPISLRSELWVEREPTPQPSVSLVGPGNRSRRSATNYGGEDGITSMVLPQSGRDAEGNPVSRSAARSISLSETTTTPRERTVQSTALGNRAGVMYSRNSNTLYLHLNPLTNRRSKPRLGQR
jgi:hypothetical protein